MKLKPTHIGLKYAEQFKDTNIAEWGLPQKPNS